MSRHRFYATLAEIEGQTIHLSAEETHHLIRVLRLRAGEEVFVFDGCGQEYRCAISNTAGPRAYLEILDSLSDTVESPLRLTLAQALAKGEKFDFIVQKATELGVSALAPLVTDYTDVKVSAESAARRLERWRRISLEALKQCGRRRLVEIFQSQALSEFLAASSSGAMLFFNERGGKGIREALAGAVDTSHVTALVGPEGGWSDDELELLKESGAKAITLGPRVLRTETAAVVAVSLIQHLLGDMSWQE